MIPEFVVLLVGVGLTWLIALRIRSPKTKQLLFLIASYAFYASFGRWFIGILVGSTIANYFYGIFLRRKPTVARLAGGAALNLLLLSFFKYFPELLADLHHTPAAVAWVSSIALPIGISFWTFQALSYLFDIYRGEELVPSFLEFCLYMGFGPTVLSGPICRIGDLVPQFRAGATPKRTDITGGLQRIWLGMFMMKLARLLGAGVASGHGLDAAFQLAPGTLGALDVWVLAIGYGLQLFFDFAGYSHIVIGLARCFGFRLPENFDNPYLSTTPASFWTKWHMSLSFWIRDYVFLPLASIKRQLWWRYISLIIAMAAFGIWHRGKLTFLLWGTYQGVLLVLHRIWQSLQRRFQFQWKGAGATFVSWAVTFSAMCLGWLFFRSEDAERAFGLLRNAFSWSHMHEYALTPDLYGLIGLFFAGYFLIAGLWILAQRENEVFSWIPMELRVACYVAMSYIIVRPSQPQPFIYFQF